MRVIAPANARECAGAMRYALRSEQICLIAENPLGVYEACEVPDDPCELFSGAPDDAPPPAAGDAEQPAKAAPAETPAQAEETAAPESAAIPPSDSPAPQNERAFRCRAYNPAELNRTASLLNVAPERLAALCCARAGGSAEIVLETDCAPGETAFIPPEKADACLWVGRDRLALCWDTRAMSARAARSLLADAAALLELPARLILERKD